MVMSEEAEILNEENRDVILQLIEAGDDLSKARDIDFSVVLPDGNSAEAFASQLRRQGYAIAIEEIDTEEGLPWNVTVVKHMLPV
jgi:regulator of RNase E activity RraB